MQTIHIPSGYHHGMFWAALTCATGRHRPRCPPKQPMLTDATCHLTQSPHSSSNNPQLKPSALQSDYNVVTTPLSTQPVTRLDANTGTLKRPQCAHTFAQHVRAHIGVSCLADASARKASIRSTIRGGHLRTHAGNHGCRDAIRVRTTPGETVLSQEVVDCNVSRHQDSQFVANELLGSCSSSGCSDDPMAMLSVCS